MPEIDRVSMHCRGAEKVLYLRFRSEPLLSRVFKSQRHIYEFFRVLVELSCYGTLRLICVRRGETAIAAAIYTMPKGSRAIPPLKLLGPLLVAFRWRALLGFLSSTRSLLTYVGTLRSLKPSGHLLFIASAVEGRGYGSLLLKVVERACARSGCKWLVLEVYTGNPAVQFYLKRGYRPRIVTEWLAARYLLMAKPLALQR